MTPTKSALAHFRREGFRCYITEKFIKGAFRGFRKDAYGFGDILAYHEGRKIIALIQACVRGDMSKRRAKIKEQVDFPGWVGAGGKVYLYGLARHKPRGRKRIRYEVVIEELVP